MDEATIKAIAKHFHCRVHGCHAVRRALINEARRLRWYEMELVA